ncbi:hypothetical protein BKA67DRAFT_536847 [Truncatella angustata]|uniref:Uncharacterized protein n=1 Tax=Truncatella angustata TaxID=152316 RepID=A0A9P8UIT3_9PEZI|nr:uncharacterized protein BKA67DRAFT_536847 [Truncatella angustata]KAH6653153.1 hypothetical protein BKA67DRAFT_536847 [Truncatella angustata]
MFTCTKGEPRITPTKYMASPLLRISHESRNCTLQYYNTESFTKLVIFDTWKTKRVDEKVMTETAGIIYVNFRQDLMVIADGPFGKTTWLAKSMRDDKFGGSYYRYYAELYQNLREQVRRVAIYLPQVDTSRQVGVLLPLIQQSRNNPQEELRRPQGLFPNVTETLRFIPPKIRKQKHGPTQFNNGEATHGQHGYRSYC